jgi:HSP20 family protein
MWLSKYEPNQTTNFDQFVNSFFNGYNLEPASKWSPSADISETDKSYFISVDIPGMESKDIKISVEDDVLNISGEREQVKEENEKYYRLERRYGKFERNFQLSQNVDSSKIDAEFKNGQLKIKLPKLPEKQKKQIEVKIK